MTSTLKPKPWESSALAGDQRLRSIFNRCPAPPYYCSASKHVFPSFHCVPEDKQKPPPSVRGKDAFLRTANPPLQISAFPTAGCDSYCKP